MVRVETRGYLVTGRRMVPLSRSRRDVVRRGQPLYGTRANVTFKNQFSTPGRYARG